MSDSLSRRPRKDEPLEEVARRSTVRLTTVLAWLAAVVGPLATAMTIFFVWEKDLVKTSEMAALTSTVEASMKAASAKLDRLSEVQRSHEEVLIYLYTRQTGLPLRLQHPLSQP